MLHLPLGGGCRPEQPPISTRGLVSFLNADEWAYRGLLELYAVLDEGLVSRLVEHGEAGSSEEIRCTASEWQSE